MNHTVRLFSSPILAALLGSSLLWGGGPELQEARKYYENTNFGQSLRVLEALPNKDAAAFELMGRDYFMQREYKKAADAFESALKLDPTDSTAALWLGRAYGRRAETSSPFTAPGYASKARQGFEKAVQIDGQNLEALSDLFEYYLNAPGFLGGGMDKAEAMISRIGGVDAAEAHWARAMLAEKKKQPDEAEANFRKFAALAPNRVGPALELARFLARQGRMAEAEQSLARAERIAPGSPRVLYAKAELYVKADQNLGVARQILQQYMSMKLTPDDPPRADAAKLLKQVQGS